MNATLTDFTCPRCGWTHQDFQATGHFRCATCMETALGTMARIRYVSTSSFHAVDDPDEHRGLPQRLAADLRIGMQLAVKDENYELAAVLRDTLHYFRSRLAPEAQGNR
jgi:protein-arginine kinase activator protein McsA